MRNPIDEAIRGLSIGAGLVSLLMYFVFTVV